jgi:hypothetical protein
MPAHAGVVADRARSAGGRDDPRDERRFHRAGDCRLAGQGRRRTGRRGRQGGDTTRSWKLDSGGSAGPASRWCTPPPTTETCTYPAGSSRAPLESAEELLRERLEESRWYDDKAFSQAYRTRFQGRSGQRADLRHRSIPPTKHHAIARLETRDYLGQPRFRLVHVQRYLRHGSIVNHRVN